MSTFKPKGSRLGAPPPPTETTGNLNQPEHAPALPAALVPQPLPETKERYKHLNFRVAESFFDDFARAAFDNKLTQVDLLKESFEAWKKAR